MRVVIGEDEALLRTGLTHVMEAAGFDVVAAVGDARELVRSAEEHGPDIVVTDIRMPPDHKDAGLRAAVQIRRDLPEIAVLVLSQHLQRAYAVELLGDRSSGVGYLLKQRIADVDAFTDDLRRIAAGGTVLDPEVVGLMVARARGHHGALDRLTPRQQQVLALMSEGRTNASIARTLSITERAVVQHTSHIYDELDLAPSDDDHRRVLAVIRYLSS
ncbi:response regulator transcription factor [Geodermatophilus poikilotrophus]|uniref:DNA-binding response regulator, NarL/FixJ family, contains REC and HTH domains n=1 Tax=Geodermatophilus poikilotrophus TaxID=1333667 RepID=A0A1H9YXD1_9ACTN|nr:response regulator transcription factor [Geodermatophilus poikilotrophus]SES73821.1 DNA-binding response regulator, NarL/FixJ family, contains REC and HTH domains [Geodermatophilus poikilotrophus]